MYVRIRADPEGAERGVDRQEADCRAYAAAHGWEVAAVFRETDTSAFKQRTITLPSGERVRRVTRPQFRAMFKLLDSGASQVMIAYDLDRAVRDPRDLEDLIDAKVLGGFTVGSVTSSLRLDTDSDVAMARVLVAMANMSSADTARRVARAAKQQAVEGAWHGGRVPFGYGAEAGALVIDPVTGPLVVEAFQRVLAGESLYRIRKDWNERGILTTHGCRWSDRTLKMVLRDPSNKGVREYRPCFLTGVARRRRCGRRGLRWWTRTPGSRSPMCSTHARWPATCTNPAAVPPCGCIRFQGLIRCSLCGTAMIHRGGVYQCLQPMPGGCTRLIRSAEIERLVEEAVLATFEQITLKPQNRRTSDYGLAARVGLTATIDAPAASTPRRCPSTTPGRAST